MSKPHTKESRPTVDKAKIVWAATRYDLWLDLNLVPRRQRKALRTELKSNLTEASADVGLPTALGNLGSLRALAAETARNGQLRSRWIAGWVAALSTLFVLTVTFLFLTLYYIEGVLDAGATKPVTSTLFPYFGSSTTVDPADGGLAVSIGPGPMPFVAAVAVWILVTKPWRSIGNRSFTADRQTR